MKQNQSGFTLIEIAIVLVIIGLLLGGVLKGQELINSAKVKNLATDFRNIPVFIYGYQDRFRFLPGDDRDAVAHLAGGVQAVLCTGAPAAIVANTCDVGNGLIDGNWNAVTAASESYVFWQHIRLAGLAAGSTDTTPAGFNNYLPVNAVGGSIGIQSGTQDLARTPIFAPPVGAVPAAPIRGTYIICSPNILGRFAIQLDIQLDDGNPLTGSMMAGIATAVGVPMTAIAVGAIDPAQIYTVCMGV